jgi:deoxyhypusine synthase
MATGTRGVIVDMVKNHMVDVIITTCGCLDHDLSRLYAAYYKGDFMMDDKMLREHDVSRLGNVLVPDDCYGLVLEDNLLPMFDEIFAETQSMSTHEIIDKVGVQLIGVIPDDFKMTVATGKGNPIPTDSEALRAFDAISKRLDGDFVPLTVKIS